jgi:hypothetical protein
MDLSEMRSRKSIGLVVVLAFKLAIRHVISNAELSRTWLNKR